MTPIEKLTLFALSTHTHWVVAIVHTAIARQSKIACRQHRVDEGDFGAVGAVVTLKALVQLQKELPSVCEQSTILYLGAYQRLNLVQEFSNMRLLHVNEPSALGATRIERLCRRRQ